jgi:hypothetical protein
MLKKSHYFLNILYITMGKYTEKDIIDGKRILSNGFLAGFVMVDGKKKFRIIKMVDREAAKKAARSPKNNRKALGKKSAKNSFEKFYKKRKYSSAKKRKLAKKRDMCHKNSPHRTTKDRRYKRSPLKWDYPGLDDGSTCGRKYKKTTYNPNKKLPSRNEEGKFKKTQQGGSKPISLKTAVNLLRQYYTEKYN